jgi:hypothetical protein
LIESESEGKVLGGDTHEPRTMGSQMKEYELDVKDHMYKVKEKSVADELPGREVADEDEVQGGEEHVSPWQLQHEDAREDNPCQARQRQMHC